VIGEESDHLVHFCHGSPGAVFLFGQAAKVLKGDKYFQAVLRAGETVWKYGVLKKGCGLCHGISGSAYALLSVYKLTGDLLWLERALRMTMKIFDANIQRQSRTPDHPSSLFEGAAGTVCLLSDMIRSPLKSSFPFFEISNEL